MDSYNCEGCNQAVTENELLTGTALRKSEKIFCVGCAASNAPKVSDSKVLRAMLSQGGIHQAVMRPARRVSHRILAAMPAGKIRRLVRRVSDRLLGPRTGYYLPVNHRMPRRQLPAASCATVAAVAKARSESQQLATAAVACVVISIFTLMAFLAFSSKSETAQQKLPDEKRISQPPVAREVVVAPSAPVVPLAYRPPARLRSEHTIPIAPALARTPDVIAVQNDQSTPPIPPLLTERGDPLISALPKRVTQIEVPRAPALAVASPDQPTAFAEWEVENLDRNATAKTHDTLDGYSYVLETRPPSADKELRVLWKLTVPADRPIVEFLARTEDGREAAMCVDIGTKRSATTTLKGTSWKVFSLDLSALRRQSITLVVSHIPSGKENASAFWQTPQFFPTTATDATMLNLDQLVNGAPRAPVAPAASAVVPGAPAKREGALDMKIEYEKTLTELYRTLALQGAPAAKEYLAKVKMSPALAPMRGTLERDERSLGHIEELRQAAIRGARELKSGESFKLATRDGKEIVIGSATGAVKDVDAKGITFEQTLERNTALMLVKWDDLSLQTQHDLAQLAIRPEEADMNMAMVKMVILSRNPNTALAREIGAALSAALKIPALAGRAENLQRHLDFFEREVAAASDFKKIEALMKASQWREARAKIEDFQDAYMNCYALARVSATLEQWTAEIQKQAISPLLKR